MRWDDEAGGADAAAAAAAEAEEEEKDEEEEGPRASEAACRSVSRHEQAQGIGCMHHLQNGGQRARQLALSCPARRLRCNQSLA